LCHGSDCGYGVFPDFLIEFPEFVHKLLKLELPGLDLDHHQGHGLGYGADCVRHVISGQLHDVVRIPPLGNVGDDAQELFFKFSGVHANSQGVFRSTYLFFVHHESRRRQRETGTPAVTSRLKI